VRTTKTPHEPLDTELLDDPHFTEHVHVAILSLTVTSYAASPDPAHPRIHFTGTHVASGYTVGGAVALNLDGDVVWYLVRLRCSHSPLAPHTLSLLSWCGAWMTSRTAAW
jgi:hypothetical protein